MFDHLLAVGNVEEVLAKGLVIQDKPDDREDIEVF